VHEHHPADPVARECPLSCLGLSRRAADPLRFHLVDRVTVGEVLRLWENDELQDVRNLGPRRIEEITAALITAGLVPAPRGQERR